MTPAQRRILAVAIGVVVFVVVAHFTFAHLASRQTPRYFFDSHVFLAIAEQPASVEHLFYPKPFVVPVLYRAVDGDGARIAALQQELAVAAWCLFGLAGFFAVRRKRARVAVAVVTLSFLFAPFRVGFASVMLSESINDSLFALVCAAAIALVTIAARPASRSIARGGAAAVLAILTTLWLFTRDTNAVTVLAAVAVAAVAWRLHRHVGENRWAIPLALWVALTSVFAIWSTGVEPRSPLGIPQFDGIRPEILARGTPSMINIVTERVVGDAGARAYFESRGMPQAREIAELQGVGARRMLTEPLIAPARAWIAEHGSGTYARWLMRHPVARTNELVVNAWYVFAPYLRGYMPDGWHRATLTRWLTTSQTVIFALLIAFVPFIRGARGHPLARLSIVLVASGAVGAAASYYGDAIEIGRHCYGAGQQIILGLFLAVIAWLDRRPATPA